MKDGDRSWGEDGPVFWSFPPSPHPQPSVWSHALQTTISASGVHVSCAIKRSFVLMIDDWYRVAGAELEHVQRQILPPWLRNISESRLLSEICQLGENILLPGQGNIQLLLEKPSVRLCVSCERNVPRKTEIEEMFHILPLPRNFKYTMISFPNCITCCVFSPHMPYGTHIRWTPKSGTRYWFRHRNPVYPSALSSWSVFSCVHSPEPGMETWLQISWYGQSQTRAC